VLAHYLSFIRALSASRLGRWGVALTTSAFCTFLLIQAAMLLGLITNAYVGLIVYLALPGLFVLGLVLLPLAWWRSLRRTGLSSRELLRRHLADQELSAGVTGAPVLRTAAILTLVNVLFLGGASLRMLHFMDSPHFCGTACHEVMSPEWTTYQVSPHARVPCVECHVGEGVGALVSSKVNGTWQMISATFELYDRPIPTPVHQLRPARETCERCHWPERFYGSRLETLVHYGNDRGSTPSYTTLNLKIDSGAAGATGVHWHVGQATEVRYASRDDQREEMLWVEVRGAEGEVRRFVNTRLDDHETRSDSVRVMDCVDCHNRATHVYERPERAVDERMRLGTLDRSLPFIRREAVSALTAGYPSRDAAHRGIRDHLRGFYRRLEPAQAAAWLDRIDAAADVLVEIYDRNIHHQMEIDWGAYPSLLGHRDSRGCFRCHTRDMQDAKGRWIPDDCTLCHSILADDEPDPFAYLREVPQTGRTRAMHDYLRDEFLTSFVGEATQ